MNIFLCLYVQSNLYFCPCTDGFKILGCLVKRKICIQILLASMKTLTISKDCSESRIIISLFVIGRFSPESTPHWMQKSLPKCTVQALSGFRNDISKSRERFQGQNRCFRASEEGYWKDFQNQLVISQKQVKSSRFNITTVNCSKIMKTTSAHTKSTDIFYSP